MTGCDQQTIFGDETMRYLLALGLLVAVGCTAPEQEARYAPPEQIEWSFEDVKKNTNDIAELKGTVSALKMFMEPRSMQKPLSVQASAMRVSTTRVKGDETVKLDEPKSVTPEQFQAFQSQVMEKLKTVSAAKSVVESPQSYSSAPVKSYASGPKTYGAPRTTGTRTVTKTRKVAKTVYEEVPYEVQEPVMTRPVYQTQVEEYQEPVQRTVMKTETRQRTKTVMVPQQVTENYSVQGPETVTEMVTKTRSKRVQVGTEEVKAPSYAAAPSYSAPACEPAPQYSEPISYSVEAPRFSVSQPVEQFVEAFQSPPVQSFSITEPVVSQPSYSIFSQPVSQPTPTVTYSQCTGPNCPVSSAPVCTGPNCQVSSAPSYSSNPKPPRTRSRLTLSRQPVQSRTPVQSFRSSRPRPMQNSANNFSSSRGGEGLVIIK